MRLHARLHNGSRLIVDHLAAGYMRGNVHGPSNTSYLEVRVEYVNVNIGVHHVCGYYSLRTRLRPKLTLE